MQGHEAKLLLILVRHAEREYFVSLQDWQQPLTAKGQRNAHNLGEKLQRELLPKAKKGDTGEVVSPLRLIFTSPFLRCKQTAAILMDYLKPKAGVHEVEALGLTPDEDGVEACRWVLNTIASNLETDCLMLVGHEPELAAISYRLCGTALRLKKSEAALLEIPSKDGLWSVGSAKVLARIKG
jgi:phosphohistidine phosphatase SixA